MRGMKRDGFKPSGLCGKHLKPLGHRDVSVSFSVNRYMVGKLRSQGRHRREDPSVRQTSILVQRCCFLTTEPFLAHALLLFCTDLACWCWGIDSEGASPLTAVSYIVCTQAVSRYIRTVPATAKWAFLNNIVYESTLCVCVWSWMCVSTCSVHHGGLGGDSCGVCLASDCRWATSITDATQLVHT